MESIARCATKIPVSRASAIHTAERLGYPVVPYKCPNGWDHWHVGRSQKGAPKFHNHRDKWEQQRKNQDTNTTEDVGE